MFNQQHPASIIFALMCALQHCARMQRRVNRFH